MLRLISQLCQLCGYGGLLKSDRILDGGRTKRDCHGIMPNCTGIKIFPPFSPSPMKSVEADMQIDMSGNQRSIMLSHF